MAATEAAPQPSAQEVVARERRAAPRAGLAALAAAILVVVAGVAPQAIYSGSPRVYLLDALRDAAGQDIGRAGLKTAEILFLDDKALSLLLVGIAQALAILGIGYVLLFLLDAAMARGAAVAKITRMAVMFGAVAVAVANIGLQLAVMVRAHDFAGSSDHSTAAAHDVLNSGVVVAASGVGTIGSLSLAAGFVLVAIAAMRVGLLTRFTGILGAIVGVLLVLGPALASSSSFIVQAFWLLMVGVLLLGRWPAGMPPAWTTGEARPWPSQQQIAEQRARARAARGGGKAPVGNGGRPADGGGDEPATPAPGPAAARKKKRKRR
ncbi:MAG TPA: hypothetical protein VFT50_04870 [Baekduia sp.]|nr:hypothetical protein [Baekduia sp.]